MRQAARTLLVSVLPLALLAAACGSSPAGEATETTVEPPEPTASPTPSPTAAPTHTPEPTVTLAPTLTPTAAPRPTPTASLEPSCVADLPARVALAQLLLPLAAPAQFAAFNDAASRREVSGLVVLGAPTEAELADLAEVDDAGVALLWSSDEEGGSVQRLAHLLGPLPSAAEFARLPVDEVRARFEDYGMGLADLGFDVVFAPVVDVGGGPGIESRSFSDDPEVVVDYAAAVIEGYQAATLVPVIKHFPGHGRASADSHLGFSTTPPLQELRQTDLVPFIELMASAVPIMVGHLLVPGLAEDLPTSLAPEAIDGLLRSELGFDGVVITDALNMSAVSQRWDNAEAVRLALVAGADLAIIDDPGAAAPVLDHLEAAIADRSLSREQVDVSVERVLALKGVDPCQI